MNTTEPVPAVTPPPPVAEDRTVAIVSYLTLIGFVVAIVLHGNKKTALGTFHLRQSLGLMAVSVALGVSQWILAVIPVIGWLLLLVLPFVWLGLFVFWVMGLIAAINGQMKPLPWIGEHFQKWFAGAFA